MCYLQKVEYAIKTKPDYGEHKSGFINVEFENVWTGVLLTSNDCDV